MTTSTEITQKEQLLREIERLETENHFLSHQIQELELTVTQKRKTNQELIDHMNNKQIIIDDPISEKQFLEHNIEFMNSEKKQLTQEYNTVKDRLNHNLAIIDSLFRDLGFVKGEIGTLIVQISMLEEEIPQKIKDVEILDDKISTICASAIQELYENIKEIENKAKLSYYNNLQKTEKLKSSILNLFKQL